MDDGQRHEVGVMLYSPAGGRTRSCDVVITGSRSRDVVFTGWWGGAVRPRGDVVFTGGVIAGDLVMSYSQDRDHVMSYSPDGCTRALLRVQRERVTE
jgi:hypothetical protein